MKLLIRLLLVIPAIICGLAIYFFVDQYIFCQHYLFKKPETFKGKFWYNPYQKTQPNSGVLSNFHAHASCWNGLTNGKGTSADVWDRYDSLGLEFHALSQYHHIDTFNRQHAHYIPAYEHGYNLMKTHQLVIGANAVDHKDYFFPQTLHNKQDILYKLSRDTQNLIVINHPAVRKGYLESDFKWLHYYNHIEILSPAAHSIAHWDTALSAGKAIFALANDDAHNIFNDQQLGRFINIVYNTDGTRQGLINSLRSGNHIAVWMPERHSNEFSKIRENLGFIRNRFCSVSIDSNQKFEMILTEPAKQITLIGQWGHTLDVVQNKSTINYLLDSNDTYVRAVITWQDDVVFFSNPLFRTTNLVLNHRKDIGGAFVRQSDSPPLKLMLAGILIIVCTFLVGPFGLYFVRKKLGTNSYLTLPTQ